MNKKIIIPVIGLILLVLVSIGLFLLLSNKEQEDEPDYSVFSAEDVCGTREYSDLSKCEKFSPTSKCIQSESGCYRYEF